MPMALSWSFVCSLLTCVADLLLTLLLGIRNRLVSSSAMDQVASNNNEQQPFEWLFKLIGLILAKCVIYVSINLVCLYTKYLIDLAQRNAFLETRRSIETRAKIERENEKQERLLLSLLPRFVALEIIKDIADEDNHEKLLRDQFHKIYIHSYSNVR